MKVRLAAIAAALLLLPSPALAHASASAAPPTGCGFQNLGTMPLTGATTAGTALDRTYRDGPRVYSVTSSASGPAVLGVRDARDGSLIAERPLPLALGSWAVAVSPDHSVYVGSYNGTAGAMGRLFRYVPETDTVTEAGIAIPGDSFVWTVAVSPDGRSVYGGTSPSGKLFRYDVASGRFTDLGAPLPGEQFVRDLAVGGDGTVYAGMGATSMKVVALTPEGRVKKVIDPPIDGDGWAYDVDIVGRHLLVRFVTTTATNPMGVYDLRKDRWTDVVEDVDSLTLGGGARGGHVYLFQGDELTRYDLERGRTSRLGFTDYGEGAARPLGWLDDTLVGTASTGKIWQYDSRTRQGKVVETTLTGQPVTVRSMGIGPDGQVYAGGFFTGGLAAYDTTTGEKRFWPNVGQSEGIVTHQGKLYLGVYPGARIYEWTGDAPKQLLSLSDQEQDRPFAMVSAGDQLAFGTVPKSGAAGGVLGLYDPATGRTVIRRNIIPGHSVIGLAYRDGVVYGATSAFGGLGRPLDTAAYVFAYDIATDTVKWKTAPVPGDLALGSITFDDRGNLWGMTPDSIFEMDPATGRTLRTAKHQDYPWASQTQVWLDTAIEFHAGAIWAKAQGKAYKVDRETLAFTQIVRPVSLMLKAPDGHLYLSRNENFYTYRICGS
ncbi:hypothetical protein ABZ917_47695 [Nonomuraea wenchangensis]